MRLARFGVSGAVCAGIQILGLRQLEAEGWNPAAANAVATIASIQVNFGLNHWFVWADRSDDEPGVRTLVRLWVKFHSSVAATVILGMLAFTAVRWVAPSEVAVVFSIGTGTILRYVIQDRIVFVSRNG